MIATARMTGAEFDALPLEEGRHLELLEGDLIEVPGPNTEHQEIVGDLYSSFRQYFRKERTGGVYPDMEFAMGPNLRLAPDLGILLGDKWRTLNPRMNPLIMAPDRAVEVISPSERTVNSTRKIRVDLREGVSEVRQVFPETAEILVHRPGPALVILTAKDRLESPLLPNWFMRLNELFSV